MSFLSSAIGAIGKVVKGAAGLATGIVKAKLGIDDTVDRVKSAVDQAADEIVRRTAALGTVLSPTSTAPTVPPWVFIAAAVGVGWMLLNRR